MSTLEVCCDSPCAGWVIQFKDNSRYIETRTEAHKQVQSASLNTECVYFILVTSQY